MRHRGQRSRRFMRRLMERMAQKRLIAMEREAEHRERQKQEAHDGDHRG
nr:MAG TPA: hypothetical protein [Caudoviricetes sp.]